MYGNLFHDDTQNNNEAVFNSYVSKEFDPNAVPEIETIDVDEVWYLLPD